MTSAGTLNPVGAVTARPVAGGQLGSTRLALRDVDAARGLWDGAWWPHTRLLVDELPGLLAAFADRYGTSTRVSYSLVFWGDAPRRLGRAGRRVRLGGFRTMNPYLLSLTRAAGTDQVDLLVVPPEADPASVARALALVGTTGLPLDWSAGATGVVTTAPVAPAADRAGLATTAERTWENEGGSGAP